MANASCVLLLWLTILTTNHCIPQSENMTLAEVALFIVREHLSNLTSTIVIAENSITPESESTNVQLMEYLLQHLNEKIAVQFYVRDYLYQPLEYYIFIVDSLEAFKEIYRMFTENFYERKFRFIIILTKLTPDLEEAMEDIFKLCFYFNVIDVNIILDHPTIGVAMFTYFLYGEHVCHSCIPILLHRFTEGIENLKTVFPEKLTNFHGCSFKVSARSFAPFLSFNGNVKNPKPVGAWENLWGIEGTLLKFLALALNFTINLQPFPVERSYVKDNRTYGCFSELTEGKVDIAVGGFVDSNSVRWIFSPTASYHYSQFLYVVRGRKYLSSLARLAKPFSQEMWYFLASFVFLNILFISFSRIIKPQIRHFIFGVENRHPLTNFFSIFLGYPVNQTPHRNFARYIFLQLVFLTLILRSAYQGSLYDAFRLDRFAVTPSGYEDLIKWNYTAILPPEDTQTIIFPENQLIKMDSDGYLPRLKLLQSLNGKYVTVIIQDVLIDYLQKNLRNITHLIFLPEVILNYQFVMVFPKHSIFLSAFNKKLKGFAEAGLMRKFSANLTSTEKMLISYFINQQTKKLPLRNKRIYALYIICALLLGVSLAVFCLEILSINYRSLQWMFV